VTGSAKDTLESLVVAFILAFAFRAFVLEAFVIPTGSMAPTLYGAQVTNTCSTCGFEYARGIGEEEVALAAHNRLHSIQLRCPNCCTMPDKVPAERILRPDSGDRILVLKWAYDLGWDSLGPKRWDVTVFKNPSDGQANYIKRLVGLPGEVLEIIDGDIYAAPLDAIRQKEPGLYEQMDALRELVARHRNPKMRPDSTGLSNPYERADLRAEYERINARLLPHLRIQRKTPEAQESLWSIVYDHDFRAPETAAVRSSVRWGPVGEPAARAWDTTAPEITFSSESDAPLAIRLEGKEIRDFVAYNYSASLGRNDDGISPVGDLRLRFVWFPQAGNGSIAMRMNRDRDTFLAEIHRDGRVTLDHLRADLPGGRRSIGQAQAAEPFADERAVTVEFVNVDYRVSLTIDGDEMLATTDQQYYPDLPHGLRASLSREPVLQPTHVEIAARNMQCRFRHLSLQRDVFYRSCDQNEKPFRGPENPYLDWPGWGTAGCPIMLRTDRDVSGTHYYGEYFMLGDNSPASKDSRRWWEIGPHLAQLGDEFQLGTVPRDQLIGRAFFVYWPAGYRTALTGNIGAIPNVGQMRWIR